MSGFDVKRAERAAYTVALLSVAAPVVTSSGIGLVGWAGSVAHMHGLERLVVPLSLDGAAMACAALALASAIKNEAAAGLRMLVFAIVAGSAWFNFEHARAAYHSLAAALFFGGMSVLGATMFDLVLRRVRRAALREAGKVAPPLPRFRALRWLRFPSETWRAWSVALRYDLSSHSEALTRLWVAERSGEDEVTPPPAPELADMPKKDAVRLAITETGSSEVPALLAWLADRSVNVDRSYVYGVLNQVKRERLALDNGSTTPRALPTSEAA
jgi:hypothetical protein